MKIQLTKQVGLSEIPELLVDEIASAHTALNASTHQLECAQLVIKEGLPSHAVLDLEYCIKKVEQAHLQLVESHRILASYLDIINGTNTPGNPPSAGTDTAQG